MATTEGQEELKALFLSLDEDQSGAVSGTEWASGILSAGNKEIATKCFKTLDMSSLDGDVVDVDAKIALWSAVREAFEALDSDNSGTVEWDEFVAATTEEQTPWYVVLPPKNKEEKKKSKWGALRAAVKLKAAMKTETGRSELKELFETLDKSGDATVTSKEWGRGAYKVRCQCIAT